MSQRLSHSFVVAIRIGLLLYMVGATLYLPLLVVRAVRRVQLVNERVLEEAETFGTGRFSDYNPFLEYLDGYLVTVVDTGLAAAIMLIAIWCGFQLIQNLNKDRREDSCSKEQP